jgi:lysophospholipid acyltransferase (LPLAT)-like uncharacterized protein
MKLRHPTHIHWASSLGALTLRGLLATLRFRYYALGPDVNPNHCPPGTRYIYAFWHEMLLLPALRFARPDIRVLISTHADGELIAQVCRKLGFGLVRGSSTRGGTEALREMLDESRAHFAITPDGPRGPRRQAQLGVVFLAARTGLPIVPLGLSFSRAWRANSWDRFAIPQPFSRAVCVSGELIEVPARSSRADLEVYRQRLEAALAHATALAEQHAGHCPPAAPPVSRTPAAARPELGERAAI